MHESMNSSSRYPIYSWGFEQFIEHETAESDGNPQAQVHFKDTFNLSLARSLLILVIYSQWSIYQTLCLELRLLSVTFR